MARRFLFLLLLLLVPVAAWPQATVPGHIIKDNLVNLRQRSYLRFPSGVCTDDPTTSSTFCNTAGGTGGIASITAGAGLATTGGVPITTTGAISCLTATASTLGCLAGADFTIFSNKQNAISVASDTNVTLTLSGGTLITAGWTGALLKTRQHAQTMYLDQ